jgi:hypothetical protein
LVAIVGDNDAVTGPLQHVHVSIVVDDQDLGRGPVFPRRCGLNVRGARPTL